MTEHPRADDRWYAALEAVGAVRGDPDEAFSTLADRHGRPVRRYHSLAHASAVVDTVLAVHTPGEDWAPVVLAAWFHDVVHDPAVPSGANEGASAVFAEGVLSELGATQWAIGTVTRLICVTAHHRPRPGDRPAAVLCDADLAVLAGDGEAYDDYVAAVRAEYGHLGEAEWRDGRRRVLRGLLDRKAIYVTPSAWERWEARARINISSELAGLGRQP